MYSTHICIIHTHTHTQAVLAMRQKKIRMLAKFEALKSELEAAFKSGDASMHKGLGLGFSSGDASMDKDCLAHALAVLENIMDLVNPCAKSGQIYIYIYIYI